MDIPAVMAVSDAYGGPDAGMVQWVVQSDEGYLELEMSWQPTSRNEVILEDIHDRIARYEGSSDGLYKLTLEGSKKLIVGEDTAPAAYGKWAYRKGMGASGGGAWSWTMILMDGKSYSFRMLTNTGGDSGLEERNIAALEQIISMVRKKQGVTRRTS